MTLKKLSTISNNYLATAFLLISFVGFLDASYLTIKHYQGEAPSCSLVAGCAQVALSKYAVIASVPVALLGALYYLTVFILAALYFDTKNKKILNLIAALTFFGFGASVYFVYLQLFVIKYICIYCMISATTSTLLFLTGLTTLYKKNSAAKTSVAAVPAAAPGSRESSPLPAAKNTPND